MARQYLVYVLHAEIADVEPPIWRELHVDGDISLRQLHHILQVAFGWQSTQDHHFKINRMLYRELPKEGLPGKVFSDRKTKLNAVAKERSKFTYEYGRDFAWSHRIVVREILSHYEKLGRAILNGGAINGPTEHCDGPADYAQFLADYSREPRVPRSDDPIARMFTHGRFDPLFCDGRVINAALSRLAHNGGGKL